MHNTSVHIILIHMNMVIWVNSELLFLSVNIRSILPPYRTHVACFIFRLHRLHTTWFERNLQYNQDMILLFDAVCLVSCLGSFFFTPPLHLYPSPWPQLSTNPPTHTASEPPDCCRGASLSLSLWYAWAVLTESSLWGLLWHHRLPGKWAGAALLCSALAPSQTAFVNNDFKIWKLSLGFCEGLNLWNEHRCKKTIKSH